MDLLVLDKDYVALCAIDTYVSTIWSVRYDECGDFELYMPVSIAPWEHLKKGNYIYRKESDRLMIVEDFEITTDSESGNRLTVTGRSLESILDRRIVWKYTKLTGDLQNGIKKLLDENVINPSDKTRKIPNFSFKASTDPYILSLQIDAAYLGDNLYDVVQGLCRLNGIGFKILPKGEGGFEFELYSGVDRSYDQNDRQWVVFSTKYENLLSTNYFESDRDYKTAALVGGEGEGAERKTIAASGKNGFRSGLDRREMFVESYVAVERTYEEDEDGNEIETTDYTDYYAQLVTDGEIAIAETTTEIAFEGEVQPTRQFVYGRDFFLGDIVQVVNEYGQESRSRISELMTSSDATGESTIPTFIGVDPDFVGIVNPNLLKNANFSNTVMIKNTNKKNQYISPSNYGASSIDHWIISGTNTTLTIEDGYVSFSAGSDAFSSLIQYTGETYEGKTVTASCLCQTDVDSGLRLIIGRHGSSTIAAQTIYASDDLVMVTVTTTATNVTNLLWKIDSPKGAAAPLKIVAAKLEEGSTQTLAHKNKYGEWVLNKQT